MNATMLLLVKSSLAMALFYSVYWIFLRKESCFTANRFYLLTAMILSVLLPLFPLEYTIMAEQGNHPFFDALSGTFVQSAPSDFPDSPDNYGPNIVRWLAIIYFSGVIFIFFRLFFHTLGLLHVLLRSRHSIYGHPPLVENSRYPMPFSFFCFIFINPAIHSGSDLADIIAHEKVHIRGYHSVDLLVAELLTMVFWFNPFVWWFERSIKQNHEYLADQGVLAQGRSLGRYKALLINQLMGVQVIGITNHLNFGLNATRITMMTKKKNSSSGAFRITWALPVLAALLVAFAKPAYKTTSPEAGEMNELTLSGGSLTEKLKISGVVTKPDGSPVHGSAVILGGTNIGTMTDENGSFSLNIPEGAGSTLCFSYVGLETVIVNLGETGDVTSLKITMKEGVFNIIPEKHFAEIPPPPPPPERKGSQATAGPSEDEVFVVVESLPEYPGGFYGLGKYIQKKQREHSFWEILKGSALLTFTVDEKGKVTRIKVTESDNEDVANAALKIARGMADWKPGLQRGKPVSVNFTLPVTF